MSSATEPRSHRRRPRRPWPPITIRSAATSAATARNASRGRSSTVRNRNVTGASAKAAIAASPRRAASAASSARSGASSTPRLSARPTWCGHAPSSTAWTTVIVASRSATSTARARALAAPSEKSVPTTIRENPRSGSPARAHSTLHGAARTTLAATEPKSQRAAAERSRAPVRIRSAPVSVAASTSASSAKRSTMSCETSTPVPWRWARTSPSWSRWAASSSRKRLT